MTRRGKIRAGTFALATVAVLGIGISVQNQQAMEAETTLSYVYQRAVSDLSGYVSGMETALEKVRYANTATAQTSLAAQLLEESSGAKAALAALPASGENSGNINRFLAQAGDYASYLSRRLAAGSELSQEEFDNLTTLRKYAETLSTELQKLEERFRYGKVTMKEAESTLKNVIEVLPSYGGELEESASAFGEYPTLIYDGPFSDHISQMTAKATQGLERLPQGNAEQAAAKFLGVKSAELEHTTDTGGGLPCYNFLKEDIRVSVTKDGGLLCSISNPRTISENKLSQEEALKKAEAFLEKAEISSYKQSYYITADGVCTFNFAWLEKTDSLSVTCYPDLIKVGVALDNGEIVSYNASGYLMNHRERQLKAPSVTAEKARESVSTRLKIQQEPNLALIPTPGLDEVLCWEFVCKGEDGEDVLVYISGETGMEERIYELIESDNGVLAL